MTEKNFPCLAILLEVLPKMEGSPSLVVGHLVGEDVDVGELMGSRRRCRTSEGEDAEMVVVVVAPSWLWSSHGLLLCS